LRNGGCLPLRSRRFGILSIQKLLIIGKAAVLAKESESFDQTLGTLSKL
jgi:hypothetical protein